MDAAALAATLLSGTTVRELSAGTNRVFRLLEESGATTILKVYVTPARERRERHALEALAGIPGVPRILDRGSDDVPWIRMSDGGAWNLAALPRSVEAVTGAGRVLRGIHDSGAAITNLGTGIDAEYVQAHFRSTVDRLERYRRRLSLPADILDAARRSHLNLVASSPRPAHTRPHPSNFLVAEDGSVTLVGWEWATLAPPEWDLSLASWRFSRELGDDAAAALWEGYGSTAVRGHLRPWIAYHAAMLMLAAAEQREGRLGDLSTLVDDLASSLD